MMSSEFIYLFWLRYESYACGGLLNLIYSLHAYLSSWSPACYLVMATKLVELFANRVDERRNMINEYLRGESLY
jgi:hypothetical protein